MGLLASRTALRVMRSPLLTRVIFGVEVLPLSPGDRYFDSATLAMRVGPRKMEGDASH